MKRIGAALVLMAFVVAALSGGPSRVGAATDGTPAVGAQATIAALQTQSAMYKDRWKKASARVNELKTQVAELQAQIPPPSPTDVPVPTDVPAPTDVPVGFTADEQAYLDAAAQVANNMANALSNLNTLLSNPNLGDDTWTVAVGNQLALIIQASKDGQALAVPPAFTTAHNLFVQSLGLYESAANDIAKALDTSDPDLFATATKKMKKGNDVSAQVSDLIKRISAERGQ